MNASASLNPVSPLGNVKTQMLHVDISRYTTAAGFVVLLYDFFLTLPDEVSFDYVPGSSLCSPLPSIISRFVSFGLDLSPLPRFCTIPIDMFQSPYC